MIDLFLIFASVMTGIIIARLFELLFEVRYNQLQQILKDWIGGDNP
jgi:prolipoprotein diacylglyceryltransferase